MNTPPNTRKFSLEMAQQNHPLVTRAGQEAKFIAYVPENDTAWRVVVSVNTEITCHCTDGSFYVDEEASINDLFLAPVGYCQGKPVFVSDKLIRISDNQELIVEPYHNNFEGFKWPSKAPIMETRMTNEEICSTFFNGGPVSKDEEYKAWKRIANKAIERAILDGDVVPVGHLIASGDVVPVSAVKSMLLSAYGDRHLGTCEHMAQIAIDKYLESLK